MATLNVGFLTLDENMSRQIRDIELSSAYGSSNEKMKLELRV